MSAQGLCSAMSVMSLLLVLWQVVSAIEIPIAVKQPPTIVKQSLKDLIVHPRDDIRIECEAKGNPMPTFSWRRNGRLYDVAGDPRVSVAQGSGTLEISGGRLEDEGEYQCFASNDLGTALSDKILVRMAKTPVWPKEVLEPVVVTEGSPLVLACNPPPGLPPPYTFWMSSAMMPISQSERVSMGLNGDLFFSNVLASDAHQDYSCIARFVFTRTLQLKSPFTLIVQTPELRNDTSSLKDADRFHETLPIFLSPSGLDSSKMVLRGGKLLIECIGAGYPTPRIKWLKSGGELSAQVTLKNYNKTLHIASVSEADAGEYVCEASNKIGSVRHSIYVQVKAAPYWLEKPSNLVLSPDEEGRLVCRANGNPEPHIQWLINGEPIETSSPRPGRQVMGDTIVFRPSPEGCSAVYQCNASNPHGYLLANTVLIVMYMPPTMLTPKNQLIKVLKNSHTFLDCLFFGSPLPELHWERQGSGLDRGNYSVYVNGTLEIRRALPEDQGSYTCVASSILGKAENQVRLEVKEPTRIVKAPEDQSVTRGSTAHLDCRVTTDASLHANITWLKAGKTIILGQKITQDEDSLSIQDVHREDRGVYTCTVTTELDQDSSSARLTVLDRPDPPGNLWVGDYQKRSARLSWTPRNDHNSPVTLFQVQFEDDWEPGKWQNLSSYPGNINSAVLPLAPYISYQFRVMAVNSVGPSQPSHSSARIRTRGAPPDVIPEVLRGWGTKKNNMEITWKCLLDRERNGPDLHYRVWWRRKDTEEEWRSAAMVKAKHVVNDTETYVPYEIKIQARNGFGTGPQSDIVIGYSGEDKPTAPPTDLRVSKVSTTGVSIHWTPVDPKTVLGEFRGYRVYCWREASLVEGLQVSQRKTVRGFNSTEAQPTGLLTGLVPYSHYRMFMVVVNRQHQGPPSNTVDFQTREGVPSTPSFFKIIHRSPDSIDLEWDKPLDPNGILIGYTLKYQTVNGSRMGSLQVETFPPNVTAFALRLPDRSTRYRFFLAAHTQVGAGEVYAEESHSANEAKPLATLRSDKTDIYTGEEVTLTCAVGDSSGWRFYWYRHVSGSDPERTSAQSSYTFNPASESEGGPFWCRGGRGDPVYYTQYSSPVLINVTARPYAVVTQQPNWDQTFSGERVTLRCDIQGTVDTDWGYEWSTTSSTQPSRGLQEYRISKACVSHGGDYKCRGKHRRHQINSEWSAILQLSVEDLPWPVLRFSSSWVNPGDSVTLFCEVEDSSTGWRFYFYRAVPYTVGLPSLWDKSLSLELLSDSNGTTGNSYTLNSAGPALTGRYVCRGGRVEKVHHTWYSKPQFLWSGALDSPVSLSVSTNRSQHLRHESLSLSCELKGYYTKLKLKMYAGKVEPGCSHYKASIKGSTCTIRTLQPWYSGVYWCESGSGEFSNAVNITVTYGPVILESPVHAITEGEAVTLRCKHRTPPQNPVVDFYKDGELIRSETAGEMTIPAVSQSDQGLYTCEFRYHGESPESWLTVRAAAGRGLAPLVVGLVVTVALLVIITLSGRSSKSPQPQSTNQDPLQHDQDTVAGPSDVTDSQIELNNLGKP